MEIFTLNDNKIVLTIRQNLVGFGNQLKYTFGLFLVALILVRMPLQCHLTVSAYHVNTYTMQIEITIGNSSCTPGLCINIHHDTSASHTYDIIKNNYKRGPNTKP